MLSLFTIMRRRLQRVGLQPGQVMLTFDDGPNLQDNVTPDLLDVLQQHSVRAGFCIVGQQIRQHPEVVRRMFHTGHLLINHTQTHQHPISQDFQTLSQEVIACDHEIGAALRIADYRSQYFRAPFGIVTLAVRRVTRSLNLSPMLLTHYGWDTRVGPHNFAPVVDMLIAHAIRNHGGMYVFHDGSLCPPKIHEPDWNRSVQNRSWIPTAVDQVITELRNHGLTFVVPQKSSMQVIAERVAKAV